METGEAIRRIEDHMKVHRIGEYPHIKLAAALNMALDALRAQQTPAKLDRSRWGKCGKCSFSERYHQYCPECGKPQTEEAWAGLERRINGGTAD